MDQQLIQIVNPTGLRESKAGKRAPRKFQTLNRRRVGLLDNNKPNADKFLAHVGTLLKERCEGIDLIPKRKTTRTAAECLTELAESCDVVINAFAD